MIFIFRENKPWSPYSGEKKNNNNNPEILFKKAESDTPLYRTHKHTHTHTVGDIIIDVMLCYAPSPQHFSQFVFLSATATVVKIFPSAWTNIFPQFKVKGTKSFLFIHQMISTSKHQNSNIYK